MRVQQETLTKDQLAKLGNTVLYFASNIEEPTKTKMLKLLYLCEELAVKKYGVAFFGVNFYAWKWGPVQKQVWEQLDPKAYENNTSAFAAYVDCVKEEEENIRIAIVPVGEFSSEIFSENDLSVLTELKEKYEPAAANNEIDLTSKNGSLWFKAVKKEKGLLQKFEAGKQSKSHQKINFSDLLEEGPIKRKYEENLDFSFFDGPSGKK